MACLPSALALTGSPWSQQSEQMPPGPLAGPQGPAQGSGEGDFHHPLSLGDAQPFPRAQ